MNAPLNMHIVRLRQHRRSNRAFLVDRLADIERAMKCYLKLGDSDGLWEALHDCQRALVERIQDEGREG